MRSAFRTFSENRRIAAITCKKVLCAVTDCRYNPCGNAHPIARKGRTGCWHVLSCSARSVLYLRGATLRSTGLTEAALAVHAGFYPCCCPPPCSCASPACCGAIQSEIHCNSPCVEWFYRPGLNGQRIYVGCRRRPDLDQRGPGCYPPPPPPDTGDPGTKK